MAEYITEESVAPIKATNAKNAKEKRIELKKSNRPEGWKAKVLPSDMKALHADHKAQHKHHTKMMKSIAKKLGK